MRVREVMAAERTARLHGLKACPQRGSFGIPRGDGIQYREDEIVAARERGPSPSQRACSDPPAPQGDVFVWVCPDCAGNRIARLRAS